MGEGRKVTGEQGGRGATDDRDEGDGYRKVTGDLGGGRQMTMTRGKVGAMMSVVDKGDSKKGDG